MLPGLGNGKREMSLGPGGFLSAQLMTFGRHLSSLLGNPNFKSVFFFKYKNKISTRSLLWHWAAYSHPYFLLSTHVILPFFFSMILLPLWLTLYKKWAKILFTVSYWVNLWCQINIILSLMVLAHAKAVIISTRHSPSQISEYQSSLLSTKRHLKKASFKSSDPREGGRERVKPVKREANGKKRKIREENNTQPW